VGRADRLPAAGRHRRSRGKATPRRLRGRPQARSPLARQAETLYLRRPHSSLLAVRGGLSPVRRAQHPEGEHRVPFYENVFISRQDLAPQQAEALATTFSELVTAQGGSVTKTEYWGLRNLSYQIKKNRKGHYTLLNIDGPAAAVAELERQMRIHEDVLRYLTVRVEALEEGQSAMLQRREERAERERGGAGGGDRGGFRGGFREGGGGGGGYRGGDGYRGDGGGRRDERPATAMGGEAQGGER